MHQRFFLSPLPLSPSLSYLSFLNSLILSSLSYCFLPYVLLSKYLTSHILFLSHILSLVFSLSYLSPSLSELLHYFSLSIFLSLSLFLIVSYSFCLSLSLSSFLSLFLSISGLMVFVSQLINSFHLWGNDWETYFVFSDEKVFEMGIFIGGKMLPPSSPIRSNESLSSFFFLSLSLSLSLLEDKRVFSDEGWFTSWQFWANAAH